METLADIRLRIDALDEKFIALLRERANLAKCAGAIKNKQKSNCYARLEREAEILRRLSSQGGILPAEAVTAIYREIIAACLACEKPQQIAYLGPPGTYTYDAARKHFGHTAQLQPAKNIYAAVREVEKKHCDYAVVPFENSTAGTVGTTMDVLLETPLVICGETMLRIRHNLLAHTEDIKKIDTIYAHPQSLDQCRRWLEDNMPGVAKVPCESNAAAAEKATNHTNAAAIASESAATIFNLSVVAADIEDSAANTTRFLILGHHQPGPSGQDKTTFVMTSHHEAGSMLRLLEPMAQRGVNMCKLESRPSSGNLWAYAFYVDVDGHVQENTELQHCLEEIRERATFLKMLGSYPKAVA
ncbi:prephenate dehydratase [Candidatus Persebacteraceae bacterium Df01]|jgi:chorismate mutase/prephenate dehydratase|uniref:Bifunctional chorismate mutase/prephenate dehydratase n=1 Tax=Candidatus Doriopsillibacter californiensis TaxID=2970740 RepID=A0ABT7QJF7_9GAMM|nr:prephenate dehydratase [Candidatus Persebacteraceae bacterium Df01]